MPGIMKRRKWSRLLDGGAVVCGVTIGSARPCLLPFRGYAAGNLRLVLPMQSRPTSPVMRVHLFETRAEAETWMAAW
jgi:hypothetical protein